jgi:predicted ATP-grasp superfamily ATP-dependent carboligase
MPSAHRILSGAEWLKDIPALVQRYIPGSGAGVFGLAKSGRPIAWFSHQRLREKPPSGGLSVLSESMPANDKLVEMSAQLLGAVDWTGVAMVEYRITPDGEPFLMEVNGRFWGSLQLSVDAGIDFPWLLYQLTIGEQILETHEYRLGTRLHWVLGDLDNLLIQIRDPRLCPNWKLRYTAIAAFVKECLNPRSRSEVFRFNDPLPALHDLLNWVAMLRVLHGRWRL